MSWRQHVPWLLRLVLGGIFIWAGVAKLIEPDRFFLALLGYELPLPEVVLRLIAITLPWLECLCGGALLLNFWPDT
ncbi:MAG TPA: MauE/DoxX family redox-associated membrane protein, partial [Opitutaceae bacterium]|nr:MauE/DoxX family redox-associated membrane protein [Opitutaceae bacterium]